MAEAIILPLATSILENIVSLTSEYVTEEIKGFKSVKKDLKAIAEDLESITSVLHDAEAKQYTNAAMKIWLRDLKSVFYDIDDLLDEVATDAKKRSLNKGQLLPQFCYYLSLKPLISRIDVSHKIKHLRLELERTVAKKTKFGLTDRPIEAPTVERDVFDACSYVNKLAILGRDEAKNNIINILSSLGKESSLSVLPIIGMGGIGKTALAKLVYHDIDQFDIKLWACVSDKFNIKKILQDVLKGATRENISSHTLGELVERLRDVLNGKKFFLVLDDLWEDDIILWNELKSILAVGGRGSAILITTRIESVVLNTRTTEAYNVDKLPDSVCWCIFNNLAFAEGEEEMYPKLCEIGMFIVKRCFGIPLIVRCLGSFLRSERDEGEWQRIKDMDNLNRLDRQYETVKQLLKLSYNKLPSHLKSCFAHLSLLAKDYKYIPSIQSCYWSALGLMKLPDGIYVKRNYFNELLSRSMLQDPKLYFNDMVHEFKMHDLLHDLAEELLGEELVVVTTLTRSKLSSSYASRYISWGLTLADKVFLEQVKVQKARAFIFHSQMTSLSTSFLKDIISNMPCLRILDFGGSQFEELPSSIGYLTHLRLLDLSENCLIKSLPNTVCELVNLECLILGGCRKLEELPSKMHKLISLRFLSLTTRQKSLAGTKFNSMPSLQHLWIFSCNRLEFLWDSDDIGLLTSLRRLLIVDCPKLTSLPNSMKQLTALEELNISNCEKLDLEIGEGLSGLLSLKTLFIQGVPRLSSLSNGIQSGASSLKNLGIIDCEGLVELPDWGQSWVSLQKVVIMNCPNLLSLPKGIRDLNSLQFLSIKVCTHLASRLSIPDGEDLALIRRVSEIWLDSRRLRLNQQ